MQKTTLKYTGLGLIVAGAFGWSWDKSPYIYSSLIILGILLLISSFQIKNKRPVV